MTEVAETPVDESPEAPEEPKATPDPEDAATLRRRLQGKDQALTRAQQEAKEAKAEAEALRQWKLEKENADITEVERLQKERNEAEADAAQARRERDLASLALEHPAGARVYADLSKLWDEPAKAMAYLDGLSKGAPVTETEPPVNLADRPRKAPVVEEKKTVKELEEEVRRGFNEIMANA